jgi:lysophospholipase L1-like esterase
MTLITQVRPGRLSVALGAGVTVAILVAPTAAPAADCPPRDRWVASWATSPTAAGTFPGYPCPSDAGLNNQTVRDIVFTSVGGDRVRIRLTNAFGGQPLHVGHAAVAIAGDGAATLPRSVRALSFNGQPSVTIAPGEETFSDPVPLRVHALQRLAVSVYLPDPTGPATQHLFAQQNNYLAGGDAAESPAPDPYTTTIGCWLFVDGVDVSARFSVTGAVVTLGNSITDGALSTVDANRRWPDDLARRFNERGGRRLAVVNAGISGNDVTLDRQPVVFGPSALHRLDRDVLSQSGVRDVILLEGINDIGGDHVSADQLIAADSEIIARVHARGLRIFGGTLVPFGGSHDQYGGDYGTPWGEQQRQALNQWIRTGGAFDGVIDFDRAIADPAAPDRMFPPYDSGDHLHPGDAGYAAMAAAVDLDALLANNAA